MWPWGHVAVAYLAYRVIREWNNKPPTGPGTVVLTFGALFPDLVDRPVAWLVQFPLSGRSIAHSAFTASVVCGLVLVYAYRRSTGAPGRAFALGYLSHLFADGLFGLLHGDLSRYAFLKWPYTSPPESQITVTTRIANSGTNVAKISEGFRLFGGGEYFVYQLLLAVAAFGVWWADGRPGLDILANR